MKAYAEEFKIKMVELYHTLNKVNIFHSDRDSEFKNDAIDKLVQKHNITRSLSEKGRPYDNAIAESTYNIIKTEFTFRGNFNTLAELKLEFFDYVNQYNNQSIQSVLGYITPFDFRSQNSAA